MILQFDRDHSSTAIARRRCFGPTPKGMTKLSTIAESEHFRDIFGAQIGVTTPNPQNSTLSKTLSADIRQARSLVCSVVRRTTRTEQRSTLEVLRSRDEAWHAEHREDRDYRPGHPPPLNSTYWETLKEYQSKLLAIPDPTTLIIVDEADRLSMNSLEQLRSIFDKSGLGMVLIGMPVNRKARCSLPPIVLKDWIRSRVRPLSDADIQVLLEERWAPVGIHLPALPPNPEVIAAVIRFTRGNFRLLVRLLTQMERVLAINKLQTLSVDVVETARENLVIGQA